MGRCAGNVECMGNKMNSSSVLLGNPQGKRLLGRHKCRWEDNIRTDLGEIRWCAMDWIHLAQNRDQGQGLFRKLKNHPFYKVLENS
jgi:hypothetical protein